MRGFGLSCQIGDISGAFPTSSNNSVFPFFLSFS
jgi:hypothetical protein